MAEKPTEKTVRIAIIFKNEISILTAPQEKTTRAESPTTARELDFDDDAPDASTPATPAKAEAPKDEAPPAKPPRPMSPQAQAEATLVEAFPSVDGQVVKAVLNASGGQLEPAFNALLGT